MEQPNRSNRDGQDPHDLGELTDALQTMVSDVARAVGSGLGQGAKAFRQAAAPYVHMRPTPGAAQPGPFAAPGRHRMTEEEKALKRLRKKQQSARSAARGLAIAALVFAVMAAGFITEPLGEDFITLLALTAGCALPAVLCSRSALRLQRVLNYKHVLADRPDCRVDELAAATATTPDAVRKDVARLVHSGEWEGVCLSPDGTRLFSSQEAYRAYLQCCDEAKRTTGAAPAQAPKDDDAASETVAQCRAFAHQLAEARACITDAAVGEQVDALARQAAQIGDWLAGHPAAEPKVQRFVDYYMPTTLKLLHTYNEVSRQAGESAVASGIQTEICGIFYTVNGAFRTLQDGLLKDTALDVSAEISALETVLAQDGLAGPQL